MHRAKPRRHRSGRLLGRGCAWTVLDGWDEVWALCLGLMDDAASGGRRARISRTDWQDHIQMNKAIETMKVSGSRTVDGRSRRLAEAAGWVALLAVVAAFAGCSDEGSGLKVPVFPVKGSVQFEGQPASGAFVAFHPQTPAKPGEECLGRRPQVQSDGTFEVTTASRADGAPAGEYAVTVLWTKPIKQGNDTVAGPNVIPPIYSKPETTPWKVTVKDAPQPARAAQDHQEEVTADAAGRFLPQDIVRSTTAAEHSFPIIFRRGVPE